MVTVAESLDRFGVEVDERDLSEIREILEAEIQRVDDDFSNLVDESDLPDTRLMRLCCAQLFSAGHLEDVELIWRAKSASADTSFAVDVQFLCAAGVEGTLTYLRANPFASASKALAFIEESARCGDFRLFSRERWIAYNVELYSRTVG